jgi:hypothetical protein
LTPSIQSIVITFGAAHHLGQLRGGSGFAPEVKFAQGPALEIGDHQPRTQPRRFAPQRFEMGGGPFVGFDIGSELFPDPRTQNLDRHGLPLGCHRAVDLRNRGRADRLFLNAGEQLFDRLAEAGLDLAPDRGEGHRRQAVLQQQKVTGCVFADDVGAGGECLAELDRCRTDRLKGPGIVRLGRLQGAKSRDPGQPPNLCRGVVIALDPAQRAMPGQRPAPAQQAQDMGGGTGQIFQPE